MIKDAIEAGRYPVDDRGRALVPMRGGLTAVIAATDKPGGYPIVGWIRRGSGDPITWYASGAYGHVENAYDLLPPLLIKELIESGTYPTENGYAKVPMRNGEIVTIAATTRPGDQAIEADARGENPIKSLVKTPWGAVGQRA